MKLSTNKKIANSNRVFLNVFYFPFKLLRRKSDALRLWNIYVIEKNTMTCNVLAFLRNHKKLSAVSALCVNINKLYTRFLINNLDLNVIAYWKVIVMHRVRRKNAKQHVFEFNSVGIVAYRDCSEGLQFMKYSWSLRLRSHDYPNNTKFLC